MSIVIAVIDQHLKSLYFYGDKRLSTLDINGDSIHLHDEGIKIFKLKDDLFIGFTGWFELSMVIKDFIMKNLNYSNEEIVSSIRNLPVNEDINFNTILAGKNKEGKLFIYSKDRYGDSVYKVGDQEGLITYSMATFNKNSESIAKEVFVSMLSKTNFNYPISLSQVILEVSLIDETVSASYDCFELQI